MSRGREGTSRRAVVIGSGFGGLALAVRLQAAGLDVTIVEKRRTIGGRANRILDAGYVFDTGPSLVTAPDIIDSVFRAGGRRLTDYVDLVPLDPFYRVFFHDGSTIDYVGDPDRMREEMARFSARDAENLQPFLDRVRPIYEAVIGERLGSRPFDTVGSMTRFLPRVLELGAHWPVTTLVNRFFRDFRHRFLFSFHPLFVGGDPFRTPSIYLMIPYLEREGGVWFARGGMYEIIEAMGRLFRELGGRIETGSEVEEINVARGHAVGVRTGDRLLSAEIVVSNADPGHTYESLVGRAHRRHWSPRRLKRAKWGMSCFLLYIGTRRQYPQLAHHTLILAERYRGLVRDIFGGTLADDFSMYLHAPTRTDPSMAPPGCESMYVLVPVPNLRSGTDWKLEKHRFTDRVLTFLESWGLDELRSSTEVLHVFTPDDFSVELNATLGNAFALEPRLTQTAWFRPQNRSEDVSGLYLVGAGTHPGAGVPGVILSAETTYGCIAEDLDLADQWDWSQPGRVALEPDVLDEAVSRLADASTTAGRSG